MGINNSHLTHFTLPRFETKCLKLSHLKGSKVFPGSIHHPETCFNIRFSVASCRRFQSHDQPPMPKPQHSMQMSAPSKICQRHAGCAWRESSAFTVLELPNGQWLSPLVSGWWYPPTQFVAILSRNYHGIILPYCGAINPGLSGHQPWTEEKNIRLTFVGCKPLWFEDKIKCVYIYIFTSLYTSLNVYIQYMSLYDTLPVLVIGIMRKKSVWINLHWHGESP